jgi:hypothetical protein
VLLAEHHAVQIACGTANAVPELSVVLNAARAQVSPANRSGVASGSLMLGHRFFYWVEGGILITTATNATMCRVDKWLMKQLYEIWME